MEQKVVTFYCFADFPEHETWKPKLKNLARIKILEPLFWQRKGSTLLFLPPKVRQVHKIHL